MHPSRCAAVQVDMLTLASACQSFESCGLATKDFQSESSLRVDVKNRGRLWLNLEMQCVMSLRWTFLRHDAPYWATLSLQPISTRRTSRQLIWRFCIWSPCPFHHTEAMKACGRFFLTAAIILICSRQRAWSSVAIHEDCPIMKRRVDSPSFRRSWESYLACHWPAQWLYLASHGPSRNCLIHPFHIENQIFKVYLYRKVSLPHSYLPLQFSNCFSYFSLRIQFICAIKAVFSLSHPQPH